MVENNGIQNFNIYDPLNDEIQDNIGNIVHIRIQQRNARQKITTIQGIEEEYDQNKLVKALKKTFACNGNIKSHPEYGEVIQLQGDQRANVSDFLLTVGIVHKDNLQIHG